MLEVRHHDFRDQVSDADPNDGATCQVAHDFHGFARLGRQRCYSVQFFKFHHADCMKAQFATNYVAVEQITPPRQFWCAVSAVETSDASDLDLAKDSDPVELDHRFLGEDGEG